MLADGERIEQERQEMARKELEIAYMANARRHQWGSLTIAGAITLHYSALLYTAPH